MNLEVYLYNHPDMSVPLEVSIGFDSIDRYDRQANRDYEEIYPYIEAVYIGNVDVMPLMSIHDLDSILNEYKESREWQTL